MLIIYNMHGLYEMRTRPLREAYVYFARHLPRFYDTSTTLLRNAYEASTRRGRGVYEMSTSPLRGDYEGIYTKVVRLNWIIYKYLITVFINKLLT